jgi:hypothetical protein
LVIVAVFGALIHAPLSLALAGLLAFVIALALGLVALLRRQRGLTGVAVHGMGD